MYNLLYPTTRKHKSVYCSGKWSMPGWHDTNPFLSIQILRHIVWTRERTVTMETITSLNERINTNLKKDPENNHQSDLEIQHHCGMKMIHDWLHHTVLDNECVSVTVLCVFCFMFFAFGSVKWVCSGFFWTFCVLWVHAPVQRVWACLSQSPSSKSLSRDFPFICFILSSLFSWQYCSWLSDCSNPVGSIHTLLSQA